MLAGSRRLQRQRHVQVIGERVVDRLDLRTCEQLLEERLAAERCAYEIGADLFGRHRSGRNAGSLRRKELYRESVRAKRARR